jgi:hypothetical protein
MTVTCSVNGEAEDLTGALAFNLRWRQPDGTVSTVSMTSVSLTDGTVKRTWASGDTDVVGTHYGQVAVTRANGEIQTFPSDGTFVRWDVYEKIE